MKNYQTFNDVADNVTDKLEYLESLLNQYISARSKSQEDNDYQVGFEAYIAKNTTLANNALTAWETTTTAFMERQTTVEVPEVLDNKINNHVNNATAGEEPAEKKKYKDEVAYKPK